MSVQAPPTVVAGGHPPSVPGVQTVRARILAGAQALADVVRLTLGPRSRRVLVDTPDGPLLSDDGVTIARAFSLPDPVSNLGARVVRESAERCFELAGDGTTTSILLTAGILTAGMRQVDEGASALGIKRGLDRGLRVVLQQLQKLSRPADLTQRLQIARISGHHDLETGDIVARVLQQVGRRGRVTVTATDRSETTVDVTTGLQWNTGCWSSALIPSGGRRRLVLADAKVLVCEHRITLAEVPALIACARAAGRPLVVVAAAIDGDALEALVASAATSATPCIPVHAPEADPDAIGRLEDLAICTGARLCTADDVKGANTLAADLGVARRVVVGRRSTRFVGGGGLRRDRRARAADLREGLEGLPPGERRESLERRISGLQGRDAVIHVGGHSLIEMQSRAEAFDDALHATRAAIAEGVVPGGGLALIRLMPAVGREAEAAVDDERAGIQTLMQALEIPARQLAANAGADPDAVVERLRSSSGTLGFDAQSGRFVDLAAAGILDPTRVVRLAVESAASVAGMLLLAEGTLTQDGLAGAPSTSPPPIADEAPAADPLDFKLPAPEDPEAIADLFEQRLQALDDVFGGPARR